METGGYLEIDFNKLRKLQRSLAKKVKLVDVDLRKIRYIAAFDVSYKGNKGKGVIVIYDKIKRKIIYEDVLEKEVNFPYVPTFLSFREIPLIEELFKKIKIKPEVVFFDGQGVLHPFHLGLASHFGVLYNMITVGVAKRKLIGEVKKMPEREGEYSPIYFEGKIKGYVLRISKGKKFLWISPGNLITPKKALKITLFFIREGKHFLMDRADKIAKT